MRLVAVHNWPQRYAKFLRQMRVRVGAGPSGEAASERRAIEVPDVFADPTLADWQEVAMELGFRSFIALPLQTGESVARHGDASTSRRRTRSSPRRASSCASSPTRWRPPPRRRGSSRRCGRRITALTASNDAARAPERRPARSQTRQRRIPCEYQSRIAYAAHRRHRLHFRDAGRARRPDQSGAAARRSTW